MRVKINKMSGYSSNCGGYSACGNCGGYSSLESAVNSYSASSAPSYSITSAYEDKGNISYLIESSIPAPLARLSFYDTGNQKSKYCAVGNYNVRSSVTKTYTHMPDGFLMPNRPKTAFIGDAKEVKEFVEEAFLTTTGREFPDDIIIHVVDEETMKKAHSMFGDNWNDGIQGFAINRKNRGLSSEIFIKKGELDSIMLTIGHEIGHVLTKKLDSLREEEAKAFAFSLAWMKSIKESNIANLATAISLNKPAMNGIHNVALDFVLGLREKGIDALSIYNDIIGGRLKIAG
jgi:hypothetical protein